MLAPYINKNQPQVSICSLPLECPSHLQPHPTPLGCHRALGWAPCVTGQTPTGYLFYTCIWNLPAILIPACASSRPASLMMYSAYKLNEQGDNIQPWRSPFPIWNQGGLAWCDSWGRKESDMTEQLNRTDMESRKMVLTNLFAGQQGRHRLREQTVDPVGEWEDGRNWESSMEGNFWT